MYHLIQYMVIYSNVTIDTLTNEVMRGDLPFNFFIQFFVFSLYVLIFHSVFAACPGVYLVMSWSLPSDLTWSDLAANLVKNSFSFLLISRV